MLLVQGPPLENHKYRGLAFGESGLIPCIKERLWVRKRKQCRHLQERNQVTLKLFWVRKRYQSSTAPTTGEYEWGGGVGMEALLTLAIPERILEVLGTQTLVQSPWLCSEPKAEITGQQLLTHGTVHGSSHLPQTQLNALCWFHSPLS